MGPRFALRYPPDSAPEVSRRASKSASLSVETLSGSGCFHGNTHGDGSAVHRIYAGFVRKSRWAQIESDPASNSRRRIDPVIIHGDMIGTQTVRLTLYKGICLVPGDRACHCSLGHSLVCSSELL